VFDGALDRDVFDAYVERILVPGLRRAEGRTFAAVADAIQAAYPAITARDCRGFYRDAGYTLCEPL